LLWILAEFFGIYTTEGNKNEKS